MPTYNRGRLLPQTISCLLAQTYADFEWLVFDDGSSDDTVATLKRVGDSRLRVVGAERQGPPHPLNALYGEARGEYLIVLHDHDLFDSTLIELCVAALDAHPEAILVLAGSADVGPDGHSNYREHPKPWAALNSGDECVAEVLLADRAFASPFHACSMVRRSALAAEGPWYDPQFGLHADVDLWFRLLRGNAFAYLPQVLFRFRARERKGHFLEGREFEILDTMRDIFLRNGAAYFTRDARMFRRFEDHVIKVHTRLQRRLAARMLLRRPTEFMQALNRLSRNPAQPALFRGFGGVQRPIEGRG